MENENVERVARAISEVSGRDGHEVSEFGLSDAAAILCARAAIAAMREPTEAMVTAAYHLQRSEDLNIDRLDLTEYYQTMIDAALKD